MLINLQETSRKNQEEYEGSETSCNNRGCQSQKKGINEYHMWFNPLSYTEFWGTQIICEILITINKRNIAVNTQKTRNNFKYDIHKQNGPSRLFNTFTFSTSLLSGQISGSFLDYNGLYLRHAAWAKDIYLLHFSVKDKYIYIYMYFYPGQILNLFEEDNI